MAPVLLVYGAYGFTGRLLLDELASQGVPFVAAGRDRRRLDALGRLYRAPVRPFSLHDTEAVDRGLRGIDVVLNAAGPFVETTEPLLRACLRNRVHYLDVSGEVGPLEHAAGLDAEARQLGVMVLPGVGFDVVPSDCLALHLARKLPDADRLMLGIAGSNLMSRGSARAFADHAGVPVLTRREGRLESMLLRAQIRWIDFGFDVRPAVAVSWGDLVTAFRTTGIPNIEVYFEATAARWMVVAANQWLGWSMSSGLARSWLRAYLGSVPEGPTPEQRAAERVTIFGEVRAGRRRVRARMVTPEAYTFTGAVGAAVVARVLAGAVAPGFQTPAALLGPDFVLSLPGVERTDVS